MCVCLSVRVCRQVSAYVECLCEMVVLWMCDSVRVCCVWRLRCSVLVYIYECACASGRVNMFMCKVCINVCMYICMYVYVQLCV